MDTRRHTRITPQSRRLLRAVSVLAIVAVSFALVGGLTGHRPGPEPEHDSAVAAGMVFTPVPPLALRATGHDAPPPPRFHMGPRPGATSTITDDSRVSADDLLTGRTAPAVDGSIARTSATDPASSAFVLFSSSASRTRGQPALG